MNFDKIYNECKAVVIIKMRSMNVYGNAEEFINQAYVELSESNTNITKQILMSKAISLLMISVRSFKNERHSEFSKETTKTCAKCNSNYPIGFFGMTSIGDIRILQPYCRDCAKSYFKEYVERDRQKWNDYLRNRYKNDRDNLTDAFIKKYLRCYGWKTEEITREVINHKRRELRERRSKKEIAA